MQSFNERLVLMMFETKALRVCPENKPFWYTSGTIGPYYINTHYLYGSEKKANELLGVIDREKENKLSCPAILLQKTLENYYEDPVYKELIDNMCLLIKERVTLGSIDYISGGERRDWFFSFVISHLLKKPHLTIYKDRETVLTDSQGARSGININGSNVLHIADLITLASSYERAWVPAIEKIGGSIKQSLVVVDRNQGGCELLEKMGIVSSYMIEINIDLFNKALFLGLINNNQYMLLSEYVENPHHSMKMFLREHPEFIEDSLNADKKTKERAKLCISKGFYE